MVKKKKDIMCLDGVDFCRGESAVFAVMEEDPAVGEERSSESKDSLIEWSLRVFGG